MLRESDPEGDALTDLKNRIVEDGVFKKPIIRWRTLRRRKGFLPESGLSYYVDLHVSVEIGHVGTVFQSSVSESADHLGAVWKTMFQGRNPGWRQMSRGRGPGNIATIEIKIRDLLNDDVRTRF